MPYLYVYVNSNFIAKRMEWTHFLSPMFFSGCHKEHRRRRQKHRWKDEDGRGRDRFLQDEIQRKARLQRCSERRVRHQGGHKESVAQTVCGIRSRLRDHQAVLPRRRNRSQNQLGEQVGRLEVVAARALPLHTNHGRSYQKLRCNAVQPR